MKRSLASFQFNEAALPSAKRLLRGSASVPKPVAPVPVTVSRAATLASASASASNGDVDAGPLAAAAPAKPLGDDDDDEASSHSPLQPFVAPAPAKYRERYASVCGSCFRQSAPCAHHAERRLELLVLGHNPSEHAWGSGYFYSNPSNRMWLLLTGQSLSRAADLSFPGVLPRHAVISEQNRLPDKYGVGFTDLGLEPGNDASCFGRAQMLLWAGGLFARLAAHERRAEGGAPAFVAFTGKRQFAMIFRRAPGKLDFGEQALRPEGWPWPADSTRVWVLPSSSGRAAMTHEARIAPYRDLAQAIRESR